MSQSEKKAVFLAIDVTTSELAVAVRDEQGEEDFVATPMEGKLLWRNKPGFHAHDLAKLPEMLQRLLSKLVCEKGWNFDRGGESTPGCLSIACRQHDLVALGRDGEPLLPSISWQCNAATKEVKELKARGVEDQVGTIEPRFVLPKMKCILNVDKSLRAKVQTVFMTGDWVAYKLTGKMSLSSSDALSNGLLDQKKRQRADAAIKKAGLKPEWFPKVVSSGAVVGKVLPPKDDAGAWAEIKRLLQGWKFVAGLGDNHASAVGCGMKADHKTLVVSAGSSGTINFTCPKATVLPDDARSLQFEFYRNDVLLLQMLADCGEWYKRFVERFAGEYTQRYADLNPLAASADVMAIHRVLHDDAEKHEERFPPGWENLPLGQKVAATQFSIGLEMLLRVRTMLGELRRAKRPLPETFVLTGGLSQSPFFQQVFSAGIKLLAPAAAVKLSGRTGPLRYKTSASGALANAGLPQSGSLAAIHAVPGRFPLVDCAAAESPRAEQLQYLLQTYGI